MLRTKFIPTILVIILGVNLGAWTLSVATTPGAVAPSLTIPVSAAGIDAQSQSASAAATQATPAAVPDFADFAADAGTTTDVVMTSNSTDTSATSTR